MKMRSPRFSHLIAVLVFVLPASALANVVEITFDEPFVSLEDVVTNQYSSLGATFGGNAETIVKTGPGFNNPFDGSDPLNADDPLAHLQTNGGKVVAVDLVGYSDLLRFEYRRPSDAGIVRVRIFDGMTEVRDFGDMTWDTGFGWVLFEYLGNSGAFNRIEFSGDSKFVIDNLAFTQPVPLPAPLVLLGSALGLLLRRRTGADR